VYQNLFCSTLICLLWIWQQVKNWSVSVEQEKYSFPRSKDIKQDLNELPADKRHFKVLQGRPLCHTRINNKKKTGFHFFLL